MLAGRTQDIGAAIFRRWDGGLAVVRVLDPHAAAPEHYPTHMDLGMTGVITIDPNLLVEDDDAARQERAMLAGMAGGCAAYNDAMGSPLGGQSYCSHCLKDFGSGHHCCDC